MNYKDRLLKDYSQSGSVEIITVALVSSLIIVLMLALVPGLLTTLGSKETSTSANASKENALCAGNDCTDCVPGESCHETTSPTTSTSSSSGCGSSGCFAGYVSVLLADGTFKRIDEIEVGDIVLSRNEDNPLGELQSSTVSEIFIHDVSEILRLYIEEEIIDTTPIHPFYVLGQGWKQAVEIEIGDMVVNANGTPLEVFGLEVLPEKMPVYNLHVDGNHTYFVSKMSVWVHNKSFNNFVSACSSGIYYL